MLEIPSVDLLQDLCTWIDNRHQRIRTSGLREDQEREEEGYD